MKTILTTLTSILLVLALTGTVVGSLPKIELPDQAIPAGGFNGSAVGCDLDTDERKFVYGQLGAPTSDGNACGPIVYHEADIQYTAFRSTQGSASTGANTIGSPYGERYVACDEPATILIDWTTDPPTPTYLTGGECALFSTGDMTKQRWLAWGVSSSDFKFAHTDNLADALVHLLV